MNLEQLKTSSTAIEGKLTEHPFVVVHEFSRDGHPLRLALTARLRKACKRGRVWQSTAFLTAMRNAQYGFDENKAHSPGGADGIFLLTREHRPANEMMRKLFDRYLDRADSGAGEIAGVLGTPLASLIPVRLVSHHLRLLGLLHREDAQDTLVLVDYDDTKGR